MYLDESFEWEELTNQEVCIVLRAILSELERCMMDKLNPIASNYMTYHKASAIKIAFDLFREKMLEDLEK